MAKVNTILVSFSGGNTSRFMTDYLMQSDKYRDYNKIIVFANTSKENPATLDFVHECDEYYGWGVVWVEALITRNGKNTFRIVNYKTAKRHGEVFEDMIKAYGIPNVSFPMCSRELKELPIYRYMQSLGYKPRHYAKAIGIRADEPDRLKFGPKHRNVIYPIAMDIKTDERFIIEWSSRQDVQLRIKTYEGNCDWCWKKSLRKKMTIAVENPEIPLWWIEMEKKYSKGGKYNFHRENQTSTEIVARAKIGGFKKAIDNVTLIESTPELDFEKPCFCKST